MSATVPGGRIPYVGAAPATSRRIAITATYSVLGAAGAGISSGTFFQPAATFRSASPTSFNLDNPTGTIVAIGGTDFIVDGSNLPTAGTVTGITLYASDFAVPLVGIDGLSLALTDLHARWFGPSPGNVLGLLLSGADTVNGSEFDDTLQGFGGTDTLEGLAGFDYLDPGRGADTIDGGDGLDMHILEAGDPAHPLILLLHGFPELA